ncbi:MULTISPECIES: metalloregulator ArsR/SmtB family transcription factor [unclassified Halomonas]|uniref:metalloregulator ArsR/SmtB family transcription factor n=1 Tax=unclassified Halomonas TaxID=2609666 RepID=UPI0028854087|nr:MULTISPECIES: metalloregulator ArsR/SmtB family transcription factor [unclassified Halomonas]MDT0502117.1 metalloregulator ArsR/SmtB family transcription factor [Halomonas sp. PAR7]MDT0510874.1 metalloregulator ArsR/SmtB family transcription factor [Halomonas sp. LES1]MDT0593115.1 metalloregulator ArsR/SmtB family transcription factor [Halomonas sp. PAR8]
MTLDPLRLFKCLSDETRLMLTLLVLREGELCVFEMTHALEASQPKVSRHLAQLRHCGLLNDRREGQWVYYGLAPALPGWAAAALEAAAEGHAGALVTLQERLALMGNRPERRAALC